MSGWTTDDGLARWCLVTSGTGWGVSLPAAATATRAMPRSELGLVDVVLSSASLVLAVVAVTAVFLAARLYGGEIGWALSFVGAGVTVFGLERLWFAFGVLGLAPAPAVRAVNLLLLFSAGLLAIGFLQLRQTIASRVG